MPKITLELNLTLKGIIHGIRNFISALRIKSSCALEKHNKSFVICFMLLFFAFLVFRNAGQFPRIFGDEITHSRGARILPYDNYIQPNFLYYFIYGITNLGGFSFLEYARMLNAFFFSLGLVFIYCISTAFMSRNLSFYVMIVSAFSGFNVYTVHFMPESCYWFGFWAFAWSIAKACGDSRLFRWILCGMILGLLSLVKPHAIFLSAPLLLFFFCCWWTNRDISFLHYFSMILAAFAVKMSLGYLFAGKAGLVFFGSAYTPYPMRLLDNDFEFFKKFILCAAYLSSAHFMALLGVFSLPVFHSAILFFFKKTRNDYGKSPWFSFFLFSASCLFTMPFLLSVIYVMVDYTNSGKFPITPRIDVRYFSFMFPLFFIISAGIYTRRAFPLSRPAKVIASCLAIAFLSYIYLNRLAPFIFWQTSTPDFYAFFTHSSIFIFFALFSILLLMIFVFREKFSAWLYLFVFLPFVLLSTTYHITVYVRSNPIPSSSDRVGLFVQQNIPVELQSKILVVSLANTPSQMANNGRRLFFIDNPNVKILNLKKPSESFAIPTDCDFVIVADGIQLPEPPLFTIPLSGSVLACYRYTIDFTPPRLRNAEFLVPKSVTGVSGQERFGRWTDGNRVTIELPFSLPRNFTCTLEANAFNAVHRKTNTLRIGSYEEDFIIPGSDIQKSIFNIEHVGQDISTITIDIPNADSPRNLWGEKFAGDTRKLGLGLKNIVIEYSID